jgi:tyrocidine synthetase-3
MVGMFVNILPQRNYPLGSKKFTDFLQEIKNNSLKTFERQDYPFELLVNKFNFMKEFNRNPLLDAIFVLQNADEVGIFEDIQIGEFKISQYNVKIRYSRSDIALMATDKNETLSFYIEYSKELFEKETINRIMQHYINILKGIVASPHNNIDSFNMLTKAEKDQVLFDFNNTKKEISGICSIKSLFESQANRYPDKTAVIFDGKKISYQELNKKSNQVAAYLREKGIKPNDTVAIMMEVSLN